MSITPATKNYLVLFLLVGAPGVAGLTYLWLLRPPTPRASTPVVINRNSLLPHRYAGPCMNCHRIVGVVPFAVNAGNMQFFKLGSRDRALLVAGQRVDVPSATERLRMPAILRDAPLPHAFVGVCSNCHVVMSVPPGPEFLARSMRRAHQMLSGAQLEPAMIARAAARPRASRALYRDLWGCVAALFLALSCVYVVIRILMKKDPGRWKGKFKVSRWFSAHEWCSTAFCVAAIAHWYYSDQGNALLHIALWLTVWLTLAGFVLRYRWAQKELKHDVRLLHSQRVLFSVLIGLIVAGHVLALFQSDDPWHASSWTTAPGRATTRWRGERGVPGPGG